MNKHTAQCEQDTGLGNAPRCTCGTSEPSKEVREWTAKMHRLLFFASPDDHLAILAAEVEPLFAEIARLKTDHHKLGAWPDCPTCAKLYADDINGAHENASLTQENKRLQDSAFRIAAQYQEARAEAVQGRQTVHNATAQRDEATIAHHTERRRADNAEHAALILKQQIRMYQTENERLMAEITAAQTELEKLAKMVTTLTEAHERTANVLEQVTQTLSEHLGCGVA